MPVSKNRRGRIGKRNRSDRRPGFNDQGFRAHRPEDLVKLTFADLENVGKPGSKIEVLDGAPDMYGPQVEQFREKFGRDPLPTEPAFFDPDADDVRWDDAANVRRGLASAMAEVSPRLGYVYEKTGLVLAERNRKMFTRDQLRQWDAASLEYERNQQLPGKVQPLSEIIFDHTFTYSQQPITILDDDRHAEGHVHVPAQQSQTLRDAIRRAERFTLEKEFIVQATALGRTKPSEPSAAIIHGEQVPLLWVTDPNLVMKAMNLARSPFPVVWIEWDARVMYETRLAMRTLASLAEDGTRRYGALIERLSDDGAEWRCRIFPEEHFNSSMIMPTYIGFEVSTAEPFEGGPVLSIDTAHERCNAIFSSYKVDEDTRMPISEFLDHPILEHFRLIVDPIWNLDIIGATPDDRSPMVQSEERLRGSADEREGVLRFVVSALALINTSFISYHTVEAPYGNRISRHRIAPFLNHRTVKITVPEGTRDVTRYITRQIIEHHKRAHRVRGHWRKAHRWRGQERPRRWIKDHVRGDASLGFINQDHVVTADQH